MKEREQEERADEGSAQGRGKGRGRQAGHPPIIIPDGGTGFRARGEDDGLSAKTANDILVEFDGEDGHNHYVPEDPPSYTSSQQLIQFIEVEDEDGQKHTCVGTPGNYRVVVTDKHRHNNNESKIIVDATSNARIDITFTGGGYERKHGNGERKLLLGQLKKLKSLEVFDPRVSQTDPIHTCELVRPGKEVVITIRDKFR